MAVKDKVKDLQDKLVRLEVERLITNVTWEQIDAGLKQLTNDDKLSIAEAISKRNAEKLNDIIYKKLKEQLWIAVNANLDVEIKKGTVPVDYLAGLL